MLFTITPILAAFFVPSGLTFPYPFTNSTTPVNGTNCNATVTSLTNLTVPIEYHCREVYPAGLTVINARYPDYNQSHLHDARQFFMLRREVADTGEIATLVQFTELPSNASNTICRLEFVLPQNQLQRIQGFNPTFNVYQVERDVSSIATWQTYEGNTGTAAWFGRVNGEPDALERTRSIGGVAAINGTKCNETLTFQMGMAFNSRDGVPNYWEFENVAPPAYPVQGFKIVYGC